MTDVWLGQWRLAVAPRPCMEASMSPGPGEVSASAGSTALFATSIGPAVRPRGPPYASTFIGRSATGFLHMVLIRQCMGPVGTRAPCASRPAQHGSAVECVLSPPSCGGDGARQFYAAHGKCLYD